MHISENIAIIRDQINLATARAGRKAEDIMLMAVSKTFPAASILAAYEAGIRAFGENRVQEFSQKAGALGDLDDVEWHMIGHLQSNKTAQAAEMFAAIDSLDSIKLAEKLNASAEKLGKRLRVLLEIKVGGEASKSGLVPDSDELEQLLTSAARLDHLEFRGLMTIPPFSEDARESRPYFRHLCTLRDRIAARRLPAVSMDVLSMGMSHDFEIAIEEGSTCVRIGTAIFGKRAKN
ncbi:MAG: YggS family pyridoxal phosphate-dependent enzyme [Terriglobales bacterium]